MKILLEKLQKLERMEEIANHAEAAKYVEYMTNGNIDFMTAKKMIQTKRAELISILSA